MTVDVVNALHFLHNMGVSHRDLKVSHVLIEESESARIMTSGLRRSRRTSSTRRATRPAAITTRSRCERVRYQ